MQKTTITQGWITREKNQEQISDTKKGGGNMEQSEVDVLRHNSVILDTSQSPITPYGLLVASFEAAKIGQEPSADSPKHPPIQEILVCKYL